MLKYFNLKKNLKYNNNKRVAELRIRIISNILGFWNKKEKGLNWSRTDIKERQ